MTTPIATDPTRPVRAGEELDAARLAAFLRASAPGLGEAGAHGPLEITQFPAGHSNLTYLVVVPLAGGERRELVLRRPPVGSKVRTAHDMGREVKILGPLHAVYPKAPRPVAYCDDESVLGAPFYVMERLRGVILRRGVPEGVAFGPTVAAGLSRSFVEELAALHAVDWRGTGLAAIAKPEGYARRQVEGWTRRWRDAKTDEVPEIERVAAWLAERLPPSQGATLVHNDFKYDNVVLDPQDLTRIVGVLDWEMATIGDPLMDLGVALGYWVEEGDDPRLLALPFGPTNAPGTLRRREVAERYAALTGRDVSDIAYYFVFALFKTAVVLQQIYARWRQGLTGDERFGMLHYAVAVLAENAASALDRGSLDPRGT
jgi:aminoglycoside phosphotransferase (APT) family kinase protein